MSNVTVAPTLLAETIERHKAGDGVGVYSVCSAHPTVIRAALAQAAADGTNYVALTLPGYTRFTDTGFDSISVQADPRAAVSGNLGRISINGEMMMQGQLRLWSH